MIDRTDPARRLAAIDDLSTALSGASMALELAMAGVDALDRDSALPFFHGEGVQYLARHVSERAEGIVALAQDRPPRWRIGETLRDVKPYEPAP
ncbi:MAG TPA: hypothetical protein VGN83_15900 [Falsiroseomonas sp.]|jgi:hypothetical protein|nr:hypothetical protein [Falsiroseomonas sp.]